MRHTLFNLKVWSLFRWSTFERLKIQKQNWKLYVLQSEKYHFRELFTAYDHQQRHKAIPYQRRRLQFKRYGRSLTPGGVGKYACTVSEREAMLGFQFRDSLDRKTFSSSSLVLHFRPVTYDLFSDSLRIYAERA